MALIRLVALVALVALIPLVTPHLASLVLCALPAEAVTAPVPPVRPLPGGCSALPFAACVCFVAGMPAPEPRPVAVIDIGSNSIKTLVAARGPAGLPVALFNRTIDARISAGISKAAPRLAEDGMARGLGAIQDLLADAAPYSPASIVLVATSAVRDAANGAEFRARVRAATGHYIRILTGDEEANLIGRGLTCDPGLARFHDFYVFDLGGGSLECLAFHRRAITQAVSLQLGCVRLTEKFVDPIAAPFSPEAAAAVDHHTRAVLAQSGFQFNVPDRTAIFAGGTMTTARAILAARRGQALTATPALITVADLRGLLGELGALALAPRQQIPGLPAARADVFPTALATLLALAEAGGLPAFHHSLYNLRWGLAAEALDRLT